MIMNDLYIIWISQRIPKMSYERSRNPRLTIEHLQKHGAAPIINEKFVSQGDATEASGKWWWYYKVSYFLFHMFETTKTIKSIWATGIG